MIRFIKYLFSKNAWDLNEIKNQIIHVLIGSSISLGVSWISGFPLFGVICGIMTGITVEFLQYSFFDESESAQIMDHFRDLLFYIVGSFLFIL